MKHQTLTQKAKDITTLGANRNPHYNNLTETQRDSLTATVMRDLGAYAYEQITNSDNIEKVAEKAIEALEEIHVKDRAVLEREIGKMVLEGILSTCKKPIEDALDEAVTSLAYLRQFPGDYDDYTAQQMLEEDDAMHARDLRRDMVDMRSGYFQAID